MAALKYSSSRNCFLPFRCQHAAQIPRNTRDARCATVPSARHRTSLGAHSRPPSQCGRMGRLAAIICSSHFIVQGKRQRLVRQRSSQAQTSRGAARGQPAARQGCCASAGGGVIRGQQVNIAGKCRLPMHVHCELTNTAWGLDLTGRSQ